MKQIPLWLALATAAPFAWSSDYSLSLSVDTTRFDYAETSRTGSLLDTETSDFGDIVGISMRYEPRMNGFYLGMSYAEGDTDYIGGTTANPTYGSHRTTTHNRLFQYDAGYQMTARIDRDNTVPFRLGIGYRGWLRQIGSTATVYGYDELYEWGYFNIGAGWHTALSPTVSMGIDADYRKAFNAEMYENWHGYTYRLKNVYGYKIGIPIEWNVDNRLGLFLLYNYEYWNIGASDNVGGYYEPDSETKNQSVSVGVKFRF